jgi:F420-dependent oxidoreductase-like protein
MVLMQLRVFTEPQQGASHDQLERMATAAEDAGLDGFFRSDHVLSMGRTDGLPGPSDAWVTLGALARRTSRIRLGTLVSPATFRLPGMLAVQVAQVDRMSGGRVELGLGAGWYEAEHRAYGIPFPGVKERFDRFEEQLKIITGLWDTSIGEVFGHVGEHYTLSGAPGLPKPVHGRVPIIIGGSGKVRTPNLAARYADDFNVGFCDVDHVRERYEGLRRECEAVGRKPDELVLSWTASAVVGRDDGEVRRRGSAAAADLPALATVGLAGTPAQVVDRIGAYAELGVRRIYLQLIDLDDIDHLELIASEVMPQLP